MLTARNYIKRLIRERAFRKRRARNRSKRRAENLDPQVRQASKPYRCQWCSGEIAPGVSYRRDGFLTVKKDGRRLYIRNSRSHMACFPSQEEISKAWLRQVIGLFASIGGVGTMAMALRERRG